MEQVEKICDDIVLINKGKVVLSGTVRDVKSRYGRDTVVMEFEGSDAFLDALPDVRFLSRTQHRAELRLTRGQQQAKEILEAAMKQVELIRFELVEPSLNEIFISVVGRDNVQQKQEGI
jgi:ABC-2 type transport system ATP-binding protein